MDIVNEYLQKTYEIVDDSYRPFQKTRPRLFCKDGSSLSIQAGEMLYSQPRQDNLPHYSMVEVGFPNGKIPDTWREYAEGKLGKNKAHEFYLSLKGLIKSLNWYARGKLGINKFGGISTSMIRSSWASLRLGRDQNTIYPYIPIEHVEEFIELHGGIADEQEQESI